MKKYLFILLVFLQAVAAAAQEWNADSLKHQLLTAREDTTKVILLALLSRELQRSNPDSAFVVGQQGLKLAQQINYERGILHCKASLSGCWWSIGDYSAAIQILLPYVKTVEHIP